MKIQTWSKGQLVSEHDDTTEPVPAPDDPIKKRLDRIEPVVGQVAEAVGVPMPPPDEGEVTEP